MINKKVFIISLFFTLMIRLISAGHVSASSTDGTADSSYKYAWSENTGWINFGAAEGNVHITDSALTGYAWSENYGWINLNPETSGVKNNGEGDLSGYGWSESLGWINFSGVSINSGGEFSGYAAVSRDSGKISFNCINTNSCGASDFKVKTDWRPRSVRGGGSLPSAAYSPPAPGPGGDFSVLIQGGAKYANSRNVALKLNGGTDARKMSISNTGDFIDASQEDYQTQKEWDICSKSGGLVKFPSCPDRNYAVYAKFYTLYGQPSSVVSSAIILDTAAPEIKITNIKDYYSFAEDVILLGETTEAGAEIILYWDKKYGLIHADEQGKLTINLGKMPAGKYQLELAPADLAGNKGNSLIVNLIINPAAEAPEAVSGKSIIEKMPEILKPLIPEFMKPKKEGEKSEEMIVIPEKAPLVMRGQWKLLPEEPIKNFILAPLPKAIRNLAEKFPELGETLKQVGITKITDIEKLKTAKLTLPGLTERVGPEGNPLAFYGIKFALPKAIPVAELSPEIKKQIPSEIVFARTGGELIDFNITLSITEKGEPQQKISTISGKPLQLAVKPDKPVKSVKGYIVFKSKEIQPASLETPFNSLLASLIFANPVFAQSFNPASNDFIPVEGAKLTQFDLALKDGARSENFGAGAGEKPVQAEEKLVLREFEYADFDGDGIYTAEIPAPLIEGEYEIITVMDFEDLKLGKKEIRLITVVDPEGYIYEKDADKETRIPGAIISLFWLNPETKQYELWPAKEYQQENPQITDVRGTYSFLTPEGYYYFKVEAPGYPIYDGKPFQVKEGGGVHVNIELKTKYWWLKIIDWKTILLVFAIILLFYNFYRDKIREKSLERRLK